MRIYLTALIVIIIFTLSIDFSFWLIIRTFLRKKTPLNLILKISYWLIPTGFFAFFAYMSSTVNKESIDETSYYYFTMVNGVYLALYLPRLIAVLFYGVGKITQAFRKTSHSNEVSKGKKISRAQFLGKLSLIAGAIPFTTIIYNITKGRFKFTINKTKVNCNNLPQAFNGLKVVQLSDIHLGNFNQRYDMIEGVVEAINKLNPDLIFITGDLVNNFERETHGWTPIFAKLNANIGKYAVLGNHDYGDYSEWKSPELKTRNFDKIKQAYRDFGFKLLLNSNETISVNGESISIIGVENWGHPPFPRYGNLNDAMNNSAGDFKILLSHDPDHWEAEVLNHTDIDLTLAGHTHGMQVGLNWKNKQWSPAKWKYKYWGGIYKENDQYLYVNRGLGFVGVPIRVGMPPEVTYLELNTTL